MHRRGQAAWIGVTVVLAGLSMIAAPYPRQSLLQHVPTVIAMPLLAWVAYRPRISRGSLACVLGFWWLHILGARWIYSFVPYDVWVESLTGHTLSEVFSWRRNHYDRLVHLASGVLGVPPAMEWLQRWGRVRPAAAALLAVAVILAIGAAYEILEWQIAVAFSPAAAEAYNGQQGDIWDPQKDLALAWIGAAVTAVLCRGVKFTSRQIPSPTGDPAQPVGT